MKTTQKASRKIEVVSSETLKSFAKRWGALGHGLQLLAMVSWTVLTPAMANYGPDMSWQPVWNEPSIPEPAGGADMSDWDSDGVPGWLESYYGTNAYAFDTDFDGISDYDEIRTTGTNPNNWDSNGNGISDLHDYYGYYGVGGGGYDPWSWSQDTDGDGLSNAQESTLFSDLQVADTDGDGLMDGFEVYTSATSPLLWDTNGNGISDSIEYYGSLPGHPGLGVSGYDPYSWTQDTDGDGLVNGHEWSLNTNPQAADTDGDALTDGFEVHTSLTSPLLWDSNSNGISDHDDFYAPSAGSGSVAYDPWSWSQDTDGDGLPNGQESGGFGTDPLSADTDGDGLTDGFEVNTTGTNPLLWDTNNNGWSDFDDYYFVPPTTWVDSDMDGLSDEQESSIGTSPHNWDTDGDGLSDYEEVHIYSTNPLDAHSISQGYGWGALYTDWQLVNLTDSDGGGIPDRVEQHYGMTPQDSSDDTQGDLDGNGVLNITQYNAGIDLRANIVIVYDRDGDGMTDVWELNHGLNPDNASDAGDDPDEDWITNLEEFRRGTNPNSSDDFQTVMAASLPSGLNRQAGNQGLADWDGDGVTNNNELISQTDPRLVNSGGGGGGGGGGEVGGGGGGEVGGGGGGEGGGGGDNGPLPPTDPFSVDSDGGGISDGQEILNGTNIHNASDDNPEPPESGCTNGN